MAGSNAFYRSAFKAYNVFNHVSWLLCLVAVSLLKLCISEDRISDSFSVEAVSCKVLNMHNMRLEVLIRHISDRIEPRRSVEGIEVFSECFHVV